MEGWVEKTLGEVCTLKSGSTVKKNLERSSGDIPYLKVADMTLAGNEKQIVISSRFLNSDDIRKTAIFPVGTTIFPKRGGAILTNKKRLTAVPICTDLNIMGVIPSSVLLPDYLYFYFLNVDMSVLGSGSSIPQINNYDIAPLVISYPPLPEQERIVAILDEAFAAIATATANAEKNLANARELFESYLDGVFGASADLEHVALSKLATHSLGKMLDKQKNRGDFRPYLRNLNVRWFDFDLSDVGEMRFEESEYEKYTANAGDLLVCEGGYPGRAAIWSEPEPVFFQKAIHRVRFHDPNHTKWFLYFLYFLDMSGDIREYFTGTGIQHLTGKSLARMRVPILSSHEIAARTTHIEEIQAEIDLLLSIYETKLDLLAELKQSILHKAFSGELTADAKAADRTLSEVGL